MFNSVRQILLRAPAVRLLALFRSKRGALGQLGWKQVRIQELLVSGEQAVPWFTYGAVDFADQNVSPISKVLELGGGGSTRYWLERGNEVVTVESSSRWVEQMKDNLSDEYKNWTCVHLPSISPETLTVLADEKFDVIVNDFNGGERGAVALWMLEHLQDDGLIIWDNTDRTNYKSGIEKLEEAGLGQLSFFGLGPVNTYASQTSFFSRRFETPRWTLLNRNVIPY